MPNSKKKPLILTVTDGYEDGEMVTHISTKFGELKNPPRVVNGELTTPEVIMCARDMPPSPIHDIFWRYGDESRSTMVFNYSGQESIYKLHPDTLVWSDGPPHPEHLQLATLLSTSGSD